MSLRMEQWTPPEWQSVIDLVSDERTLQKMAGYRKRISARYMREELFSYLMFVSAETIDRFNDRFMDLNDGKLDLAGFLEADAADERPRRGTGV